MAATPEAFTVAALPMSVAPSKKLTVPSDEPVGTGAIVAVNVIVAPKVAGFGAAVNVVAVGAVFTVRLTAEEVDVADVVLPEYTAVRLATPTGNVDVVVVATPDEFTVAAAPIWVAPMKKLTVPREEPVGAGETVAVSVTVAPNVAGLGAATRAVVVACNTVRFCAADVDVAKFVLPE
jgi:hypothetical protein